MNLKEFTKKYGNKEVEEEKLKELLGIKESKVWKPLFDEQYWYVDGWGDIYQDIWDNTTRIDKHRYSIGNCYKTEEEAVFARDKQIFMTQLERDFIESSDEIDWNNFFQEKYNLLYHNEEDDIKIDLCRKINSSVSVTTNKEWLRNYIKENDENIKKYLFGIDE